MPLNVGHHRPMKGSQSKAIEMVLCWRTDDGPTLNASLVAL